MNIRPHAWWALVVLIVGPATPIAARATSDAADRIAAAKALDHHGYVPTLAARAVGAEVEPNDSPGEATPLEPGTALDAAVAGTADEDWFSLSASAGSWVTLSTSSAGSPATDTVLEVFASDGTTRLAMDDDSGLDLFSALEHVLVPGDGVLLLRVTRFSALGDDAYRVLAEAGSPPPPVPANDLVSGAHALEGCNTAVSGSTTGATGQVDALPCLDVDPTGGEVFYRVTVPFSFELTVLLEPTSLQDLSIYLFSNPADPQGSCIDAADIGYAAEAEMVRFLNEALPGQDREVYIAVDSWSAASAGDFILSTRCDFVVPNEAASFGTLKSRFQGN